MTNNMATFDGRAVWLMELLLKDFPAWGIDDAAADAGNAGGESEIQMIQEAGQIAPNGGWGLYQWTGVRRTAFMAYCTRTGRDPGAMQSGYDFHFVELKGAYAKVVTEVAAAATLNDKVTAFEQHYEMAGTPRMGPREDYAARAKAAYLLAHPVKPVVVPPAPPVLSPKPAPTPIPPNPSAPDDPGTKPQGSTTMPTPAPSTANTAISLTKVVGWASAAAAALTSIAGLVGIMSPTTAVILLGIAGALSGFAHGITPAQS